MKPHTKNPTIFAFFKQLNWVEDLGSGIRNMYKYCPIYVKKAVPIMEEDDIFRQTVRYEKEKPSKKQDGTNTEKVLALLRENPKITAKEMAESIAVTKRTIERLLSALTQKGIVRRKGSDKDGEWIIIE